MTTKPAKQPKRNPKGATVHPETQQHVRPAGPVDENSSKVSSSVRQRDARTGHDRDGNSENAQDRPSRSEP